MRIVFFSAISCTFECLFLTDMAQYYSYNRENAKRKTSASSLKEAIEDMLEFYKLRTKFDETYVAAHWEQIMGAPIAARTTKVYITEAKLYIQLDSASLRNELLMAKNKILQLINQAIGAELVNEVIFL
ncbi:DUF721 domain-containing protein [Flectobacillus sp. DC10W]|jgi:predicted nucleic acid-binding Zn ribbon protein|uniref:DUF721 domain-containing protein n=2 Tax=Flectobacillus TaxID=101 RepID=A0ABT6YTA2_9BACT|nr:DUF721 domain-containing protein [Flectobacillus longus]MDI9866667.1 DUF721 domain-containing protein [Flectobacillus longus]